MVYDGRRFRGEARLAGNIYGMPFGIDAGFGDVLTSDPDIINGITFLEFIDVKPAKFRGYPRETHVAEKLHAYTLPRPRENSRVKDLPDLALLGQTGAFDAESLRHAVQTTFAFRNTHPVPARIPSPPTSWGPIYARMAKEDALPWSTIDAIERVVRGFLDPLLGNAGGTWDPKDWTWSSMTYTALSRRAPFAVQGRTLSRLVSLQDASLGPNRATWRTPFGLAARACLDVHSSKAVA